MLNVKKLSLGFYDTNVGEYDEYNPRYVNNKTGVPEILISPIVYQQKIFVRR